MIKHFILVTLLFTISIVQAQENIPLENWRMHLSYHSIFYLAHGDNKIFASANNGIFYFDKEDNSINTLSKIDGLSDVGISSIAYSNDYNVLLIGYENGNIDIWKAGTITNINTVLLAKLNQTKDINHFNVQGQYCYISTNFGVLILNLETGIIEESIQNLGSSGNNLSIFGSTVYSDSLFLATESGIIASSLSKSVNMLDYNNWKRFGIDSGAPISAISSIVMHNNSPYAAEKNGNIYKFGNGQWVLQPFSQGEIHNNLCSVNNKLIISTPTNTIQIIEQSATIITNELFTSSNYALLDDDELLWVADNINGLVTNKLGTFETIVPEGPFSDKVAKLYYHDNKIFGLSGGIGNTGLPLQNKEGFYIFENGFWSNYNTNSYPAVTNNLVDITFNPTDNHYYLASYGNGLLKYDGVETFEIINNTNSPMETWNINSSQVLISSVRATSDGLWVANYGSNNPLHFLSNLNQWSSYSQTLLGTNVPLEIEIAENGDKWIRIDPLQNGKIIVFNEATEKSRILDKDIGNGDLPVNDIYEIEIDREGLVWIGSGRGVSYFTSTYGIENQNIVDSTTPIIDGFSLLRDERITAIAIDGGNRKWIGTDNGIWLFDKNAQNQLYYFNQSNSPLISNRIIDIAIHDISGEVFIATDKGIVSFRSPASEGSNSHQHVKIFPNPVLANFEGVVGISGLAQNNIIKITDISGKLIRQMRANGGTASWDVRDYNGRRAATGMYLIFSASDNGEETYLGKIAVVE